METGALRNLLYEPFREYTQDSLACREIPVKDDDTFLVSYPKSGNTWLRLIIANVISSDATITLPDIEKIIPNIYRTTFGEAEEITRPRLLKSHEYFDPRYPRTIYISRDPRDVAVSFYHHLIKKKRIPGDHSLEEFVERFISIGFNPFGTWSDSVGSWRGARLHSNNFLFLRYEDLYSDTFSVVQRVCEFLALQCSAKKIAMAIRACDFSNLQKMERQQSLIWVETAQTYQDAMFFRRGQPGVWRDELPSHLADMIHGAWRPLMKDLGYT